MSNFVYIHNNSDLVYINISFSNFGRIVNDYNSIAAEVFFNEFLDDEFYLNLERNAIEINVSSGYFDFSFGMVCLKKQLKNCIYIYKKMVENDDFSNIKRVKDRVKNSYLSYIQEYDNLASMKLYENYFDAPFKNAQFGDFENINENELRKYIKSLKNQANKIVVSANLNDDELALLKTLSNDKDISYKKLNTKKQFLLSEHKDINQAFIRFCSPCEIKDDKERATLMLSSYVLGGGFGSRITEEIRVKRGLAYSAFAFLSPFKSNDLIAGFLQTKSESENEAINIVKDEFNKIIDFGINKDEFSKAKEFLLKSDVLKYATMEKRHIMACNDIFSNKYLGYYKDILKILDSLKYEEINDILKAKSEIKNLSFFVVSKNE